MLQFYDVPFCRLTLQSPKNVLPGTRLFQHPSSTFHPLHLSIDEKDRFLRAFVFFSLGY